MAGDLSAHRRRSSLQTFGYFTDRRTGSNPSRDVFPLRQREHEQRASAGCRNNPIVLR